MWAISNFWKAFFEPLFVFLMLCFHRGDCLKACFSEVYCQGTIGVDLIWAGLLLGLAILTRPVAVYALAFYLPIGIPLRSSRGSGPRHDCARQQS